METGVTQSASLVAQMQYFKSTSRTATIARSGEGIPTAAMTTDTFELSIKIDATFVGRVLQESLENRLNEALESAGIESSAAELLASGQDFSPEATASRIVEFSVSFYAQYQSTHATAAGGETLDGFVALIKGAIEEGFAGARAMLEGFQEMDEGLWGNMERTHTLTMEGIDSFAESMRSDSEAASEPDATNAI